MRKRLAKLFLMISLAYMATGCAVTAQAYNDTEDLEKYKKLVKVVKK